MKARRLFLLMILTACPTMMIGAIFMGCGDDDKGTTPADTSYFNAYMAGLPAWEDLSPSVGDMDDPIGETIGYAGDGLICSSTPCSLSTTPEDIVTFGSRPDILYLGSLIQGKTYLGGLGTMEELPIRQRAPLTIALDLFSGTDITRTVNNPDAASIQSALSDMIAEAATGGHQAGNRVWYEYKESYSSTQAALSLGFSFNYMGAYGRGALDFETSSEKNTITAFYKQIMFEAYVVLPQRPSDFFSGAFTQEILDEQIDMGRIGPDNLPVYVAKIQYGRLMMFSMTHTSEMSLVKTAVKAGYEGLGSYSAEMQAKLQNVLNNSTIKVAIIGGSDSSAVALLKNGNLQGYFSVTESITTAKPIAYQLYNLKDNSLAYVGEATAYDLDVCSQFGTECYLNKTLWQNRVKELAGNNSIIEWPTTAENVALADEVIDLPVPNEDLGKILTFDSSSTGFPFTFRLTGYQSIVYDDREGNDLHYPFGAVDSLRLLSPGDVDDLENDNFTINIVEWGQNTIVFAVGITVTDNSKESDEYIEVTCSDPAFNKRFDTAPDCQGIHGFIGIVSSVPIMSVLFNENNGGDDIAVRDFCFGVVESTD